MKAVIVESYGDESVLQITERVVPEVTATTVLIKVMSAGVNPVYTYAVSGNMNTPLPFVPGGDIAGVVEQVGEDVQGFQVGDRVWGMASTGGYAQYALAEEKNVFKLPEDYSFDEGAGVRVPYGTALHAMLHFKKIEPGHIVLVHGASGGVGTAALQLLRRYENITVIATVGTEEGKEIALSNGAHHVFNHREEGYMKQIASVDQGVDIIYEMLANVNLGEDIKILKRYGEVVVIGSRGPVQIDARDLMFRNATIAGLALGIATPEQMKEIMDNIEESLIAHSITPVIGARYALDDVQQAHHDIIYPPSGATGKIVLLPWTEE